MTKKFVFGAALFLLIVAIAAPSASAACNPPKSASTYNSVTGLFAYWHTTVPVDVNTKLVGRIWQSGGNDFTGTCNTAIQAGHSAPGFLYFGADPQDIGMSLTLGDACVPGALCPGPGPLFVQATVNNGGASEGLVTVTGNENVTPGINYDYAPQGNHTMAATPRPKINNSSRVGGTVNLGVHVDATASGFFQGTGSDVTGYNVVSAQAINDPGTNASAYTLRQNVPNPGGASPTDSATSVDCTNLALGKQWVALQLVTTSGGPSSIVGPRTQIQCDPALADPGDKFKIVPKPKVVPNSKAKH